MSWQAYVDEHLMCEIDGHHLIAAAIVGLDGSVWAQSSSFPQILEREEVLKQTQRLFMETKRLDIVDAPGSFETNTKSVVFGRGVPQAEEEQLGNKLV